MDETILKPIINYLENDNKHLYPVIIIERDDGLNAQEKTFSNGLNFYRFNDKKALELNLNVNNYTESPFFSAILKFNAHVFNIDPNEYWLTFKQNTINMSTNEKLQWINDEFDIGYLKFKVFRGTEATRMIDLLIDYLIW
mgnify:CR=1 FL=1|tara:strand:+ start:1239 stop:1658 length:420 start_codon:yes stop_codon:yes gene_type:complete